MSPLRAAAGRRRAGWLDHLFAVLGCLAAAAATGAVLVLIADLGERLAGASGPTPLPLALFWVFAINLMSAPASAWPLVPLGGAVQALMARLGADGWAVAMIIGIALAALFALRGAETVADAVIRMTIGGALSIAYWKVLDFRTNSNSSATFTDH